MSEADNVIAASRKLIRESGEIVRREERHERHERRPIRAVFLGECFSVRNADDAYFRETALLVARSQQMVAAAQDETHRAALAAEGTRRRIAESLEAIETSRKLAKIQPAMISGKEEGGVMKAD